MTAQRPPRALARLLLAALDVGLGFLRDHRSRLRLQQVHQTLRVEESHGVAIATVLQVVLERVNARRLLLAVTRPSLSHDRIFLQTHVDDVASPPLRLGGPLQHVFRDDVVADDPHLRRGDLAVLVETVGGLSGGRHTTERLHQLAETATSREGRHGLGVVDELQQEVGVVGEEHGAARVLCEVGERLQRLVLAVKQETRRHGDVAIGVVAPRQQAVHPPVHRRRRRLHSTLLDDGVVLCELQVLGNGLQETVIGRLLIGLALLVAETVAVDVGLDDAPGGLEEVFVVLQTLLYVEPNERADGWATSSSTEPRGRDA